MYNKFRIILCFFCLLSTQLFSQINLVSFSTGYEYPVDIKNCGDDRLFIVEQRGRIQICDTAGVKNPQAFLDIVNRVRFNGGGDERGLLGLAFPADFLTSGYFYVNYIANTDGSTRISRFHVDSQTPDSADAASEEIILVISQPYSNHNGGHLAFGPDGYLYIGTGDGGSGGDPENRAQNPDSLLGKMLRISVDPNNPTYSIPPTNPFADGMQGAPEVWSLGLRNPFRFSFDRLTGDMWIGDVGQNAIEEVDFEPAGSPGGLNYGWRCYEGSAPYNTTGCLPASSYVSEVFQYNHNPYYSITGGYVYRGSRFQELYGKYFFTDYARSEIRYLEPDSLGGFAHTNLGLLGTVTSVTSFGEDRNGEIYCTKYASNGSIHRLISGNCAPVATINAGKDTVDDCSTGSAALQVPFGNGNTFQWEFGGNVIGSDSLLIASQQGMYKVTVTNQSCTSTDSIYVKFTPNINLNFIGLDTIYCIYNSTVNLLPSVPGGTFSGPGTNDSVATFSPSNAGLGLHTVTYNYTTASGCLYDVSKDVHIDACLNILDNEWTNSISIYPNPSEGIIKLGMYAPSEKSLVLEIYDLTCRKVFSETIAFRSGQNQLNVSTDLLDGIYIVKLFDESSSTSRKILIRK